ncbi:hypothetical protein BDY21DRAFT_290825 [Lineolata rhizophorae]|uniref:Uncharacterized protein n=1 Tax=Lineolata rhizophorae TaxID=578093 RepID=A0A6A6NSI5_9PEZI|nr:hypothetical protein BDY21DRAFT_290825 [Lineolata rhizophorae]
MSTNPAFLRFWLQENCRDALLDLVDKEDLPNLRLVCHDFASRAAPRLFTDLTVSFKSSSFGKPAKMKALERFGHHVKTFKFHMPHSPETFLPPLLDPMTGEERTFHYVPQVYKPATLIGKVKEPKYGSWEMTELLINQYPPLFHAATNVPSFIQALSAMPNMAHLKICCPGQDPVQRFRRSIVDYALISLRIAVERSPLDALKTLSLLPIHPAGPLYLQPVLGFGATPRSVKRWSQIRHLVVHMESFPYGDASHTEHLRVLHAYLRTFAPTLTRLFFRWKGEKGPCPFTLDLEPVLLPSPPPIPTASAGSSNPSKERSATRVHLPAASPASAPPPRNAFRLRPLRMPKLKYTELENAAMDSTQVSAFITRHRRLLSEFNFEDVALRSGDWDSALAPLTNIAGSDAWRAAQEEVMDVPLVLSPVGLEPRVVGSLLEEQSKDVGRSGVTLSRWLGRGRTGEVARKAKEQFWGCEEHMRKLLRNSVFPWR